MPNLKELLEPEMDQDFGNEPKITSAGFNCEFSSSNQAMVDAPSYEIVRELKHIIAHIEAGKNSGAVMDYNGNKMGTWNYWTKGDEELDTFDEVNKDG